MFRTQLDRPLQGRTGQRQRLLRTPRPLHRDDREEAQSQELMMVTAHHQWDKRGAIRGQDYYLENHRNVLEHAAASLVRINGGGPCRGNTFFSWQVFSLSRMCWVSPLCVSSVNQ